MIKQKSHPINNPNKHHKKFSKRKIPIFRTPKIYNKNPHPLKNNNINQIKKNKSLSPKKIITPPPINLSPKYYPVPIT